MLGSSLRQGRTKNRTLNRNRNIKHKETKQPAMRDDRLWVGISQPRSFRRRKDRIDSVDLWRCVSLSSCTTIHRSYMESISSSTGLMNVYVYIILQSSSLRSNLNKGQTISFSLIMANNLGAPLNFSSILFETKCKWGQADVNCLGLLYDNVMQVIFFLSFFLSIECWEEEWRNCTHP